MYVIKNDTVIPVEAKTIVSYGRVHDARIDKIEQIVAGHYNTTVHELNVFYRDTEAKIMCCFLLHDMFNYSIGSIAAKYHIDRLFLRNKIKQQYIKCLQNKADMQQVTALRSAFFVINSSPAEPAMQ